MSAPQTPQQSVPPLHEEVNQAYVLLGQRAIFVAALKEQIILLGKQLEDAQAQAAKDMEFVATAKAVVAAYEEVPLGSQSFTRLMLPAFINENFDDTEDQVEKKLDQLTVLEERLEDLLLLAKPDDEIDETEETE